MKILLIHSDLFEYKVESKAIQSAEDIEDERKVSRMEEVLVAFCTVEEGDEAAADKIAKRSAEAIADVAKRVKAEKIMVYPYAHLSSSLASPSVAIPLLGRIESLLKSEEYVVERGPFGWYKSFTIKCKGHPLSELSRSITSEAMEEAEIVEERLHAPSEFCVLTPDGSLVPVAGYSFEKGGDFEKFVKYEAAEHSRLVTVQPPHVRLMRRHELADYEPMSDIGNLRWWPKGRLMRSLIERQVAKRVLDIGAQFVETPIMYDVDNPVIKEQVSKFPERQYRVSGDEKREFFLRFAGDFGQFSLASSATLSYRNLPLRIYELTKYSFRKERSGEVVGLRRLRCFTMPDLHTLCADVDQAVEEFERQFDLSMALMDDFDFQYETAFRVVREFYDSHSEWILSLVKRLNKPVLIEILDERNFYWILKFEFNFVEFIGKAAALSTVQIDVESAERYGMTYADSKGESKHPTILHTSPSGAVERVIYATLESAAISMDKGETPHFPVWMSPIQARIIPVTERNTGYCEKLLAKLKDSSIRVDLDDRQETVSKRIRDAETEWIPYILVVGDEEERSNTLSVRVRGEKTVQSLVHKDFLDLLKPHFEDKVFEPSYMPDHLSKRPVYFSSD